MKNLPAILFFDVNETLLDLEPVKRSVSQTLGNRPELVPLWFTNLLQYSLVVTVSDQFRDFGSLGVATLRMLAESRDITLSQAQAKDALKPMLSLAPYPEVKESLEKLRCAGFRLVALTNSSQQAMEEQLRYAGLSPAFECMLSVEQLGFYKPHQHVYRWAAYRMRVAISECMMVAAHAWDVTGAQWAGMQTTFVKRTGKATFPLAPEPDLQVNDLREFARMLTE
jgi:2-haloacid dehalogenase